MSSSQTIVAANRSSLIWMNRSQCNGSHWPPALRDYSVMRSPPSTSLASEARGEAYSSRQPTTVTPSDREDPLKSTPFIPLPTFNRQNLSCENASPNSLRRRASQGSLLNKPSAVSRFLSKGNPRLQIPDFDHLRTASESLRVDSRIHLPDLPLPLSAHSGVPGSHAARPVWDTASKGLAQGDYYSTLPPTPPDDDEHVAWNPRSGMLFFETPVNQGPGPMDEGLNREGPSRGAPDDLGSPDAFSNPSSLGGSQGSPGDPMDCDQNLWPDNGIEAVGMLIYFGASRVSPC